MADLQTKAAEILAAADGDVQKATDDLFNFVTRNEKRYREMADPLVREGCYSIVRLLARFEAAEVWNGTRAAAQGQRAAGAMAAATVFALMNYRLPGGAVLKDATGQEVAEAACFYMKQGRTMIEKGTWLEMIAKRVPQDRTVSSVLTENDLLKMQGKLNVDA